MQRELSSSEARNECLQQVVIAAIRLSLPDSCHHVSSSTRAGLDRSLKHQDLLSYC